MDAAVINFLSDWSVNPNNVNEAQTRHKSSPFSFVAGEKMVSIWLFACSIIVS